MEFIIFMFISVSVVCIVAAIVETIEKIRG